MSPQLSIAAGQLERMRGMNAAYHRRFFADIRYASILVVGLLVVGHADGDGRLARICFLLLPVVALVGACQTAFDAYYLIFSRHYAASLERYINAGLGTEVLVAHRMEETYMFPLGGTKIVTLGFGTGFTWFGFMTAFYTVIGATAYVLGLWWGLPHLAGVHRTLYLVFIVALTAAALAVGGWWFIGGAGERRLAGVLDHTPEPE